jgi:CDP-2,3-bis-(O-geranylgeranyl)-sn-glycerol synthase
MKITLVSIELNDFLNSLYFIVPAYIANATPTIFGGGNSIDLGKKFFDGERILGANKTIKGFLSGFIYGFLSAIILHVIFNSYSLLICALIPCGSLCGDLLGAFMKRRLKFKPGFPLPLIDQLDFILGGLLFSYPFIRFNMEIFFIIILITPPIHLLTNMIAYFFKIKDKYW